MKSPILIIGYFLSTSASPFPPQISNFMCIYCIYQ